MWNGTISAMPKRESDMSWRPARNLNYDIAADHFAVKDASVNSLPIARAKSVRQRAHKISPSLLWW